MQAGQWRSPKNSVIAGASAGFVSSVVTCPLDVIKTKLQAGTAARGSPGYLGIAGTVKQILIHDGLRGMYRGLGPTMLGYLPTWAIYFTVYDGIKTYLGRSPLDGPANPSVGNARDSWSVHILASMTAGATGTICTSPLWVIKTRFMTQPANEPRYRHTLDAFTTIFRNEGFRAFYRGLVPSLFGVSHVAIQFPLYEHLKLWFAAQQPNPYAPLPQKTILLCTAISKFTATMMTYPHEVVRTRLQVYRREHHPSHHAASAHDLHAGTPYRRLHFSHQLNSHPPSERPPSTTLHQSPGTSSNARSIGTLQMAARIFKEDGWRGFYKGLSVNLVRTIPNSAVTLLTYEVLMRHLVAHP